MSRAQEYFDRMTKLALLHYEEVDSEQLFRQVRAVMREVERDARHQAAEMVGELAANIHNMQPISKVPF